MRSRHFVLLSLAAVLPGCPHRAPDAPHDAHHRFDDPEAWAARFDDPGRDAWQKPDEVVRALALPPTASMADLGAATGYFAVRFARALPQGTVYGVDIESTMVEYLKKRAEREQLPNLVAVLAATDDAKLPSTVDLILVVNTYHHIDARERYFAQLMASLKPGGRLVIIDFTQASKLGPPAGAKLAPEAVTSELTAAGYEAAGRFDFLPEQYFLAFRRP